jgi:hypothetical protein
MRRYKVHYNGSRPYTVTVIPSTKQLMIGDDSDRLIKSTKYRQIWLGNTPSPVGAPRSPGHSVLAELPSGELLFVCHKVMTFHMEKGDAPVKYVSYVGNNDVVYAYLVGERNTYMLLENEAIPNEFLDAKKDAYGQYYGALPAPRGPVVPHAKKYAARTLAQAQAE